MRIGLDELRRLLDARSAQGPGAIGGFALVDVREPAEHAAGAIPGSISVPRGTLAGAIGTAVPDRRSRVVLYCQTGARADLAARTLAELGYEDVCELDAGFARWKELGHPVTVASSLGEQARERYARHLLLPEIGEAGQEKLLAAKVLVVGAGGLGSPAALYLAAAGVGTLGIVDADAVDLTNLQRQVIHATSRIGRSKVESAASVLADLNPDTKVVAHHERLRAENVALLDGWDVVVDASDNFPTRYLLNDACVARGTPFVHGSVYRFDGQVSTFVPGEGPCYRCLHPAPPPPELAPSCQEGGVLGVLPGIVGVLQATEAIKLVVGVGDLLIGRLLMVDALRMKFREIRFARAPACVACGGGR